MINLEEESANSKSRAIAGGLGAITTGILVGGGLYVLNRNMSNRRAQTNESAKASPTWPPNRQIKLLNAEERLYEDTQNVVPVKTEFPEPPIQVTHVAIETEKPNNEPYEDLSVHKDVFEYVLSPGPQGSQGEKEDSKTEESKEESPKVFDLVCLCSQPLKKKMCTHIKKQDKKNGKAQPRKRCFDALFPYLFRL